jgi:hypothetical protein
MTGKTPTSVELLEAVESAGNFFAVVRLERDNEQRCFRFGISRAGYTALKQIQQARIFDELPGVRYLFHFVGATARYDADHGAMAVKVVQGDRSKHVNIDAPLAFIANLKWWSELDDWDEAAHLAVPDPRI